MKQTLKIILGSALATAAVMKAVPALAEAAPAKVNVSIVRTSDLDLSTTAGRAQLDHRLVTAAREVCGPASDVDLVGKNEVRLCRKNVLADARAKTSERLAAGRGPTTITIAAR
jgi:UrcA family protein